MCREALPFGVSNSHPTILAVFTFFLAGKRIGSNLANPGWIDLSFFPKCWKEKVKINLMSMFLDRSTTTRLENFLV